MALNFKSLDQKWLCTIDISWPLRNLPSCLNQDRIAKDVYKFLFMKWEIFKSGLLLLFFLIQCLMEPSWACNPCAICKNISGQFHQTETLISDEWFMLFLLQSIAVCRYFTTLNFEQLKTFLFVILFFHGSTKNPKTNNIEYVLQSIWNG